MSQEEFKLWNNLDIYGYRSKIGVIEGSAHLMIEFLLKGKIEKAKKRKEAIDICCTDLGNGIDRIDLKHYDSRFPLDAIKLLTEHGPEKLKEIKKSTAEAFFLTINGKQHDDYLQTVEDNVLFLNNLADKMDTDRYRQYRETITENDRK